VQLIKELEKRRAFLEEVISQLEYNLSRYPAGTLVFHNDGKNRNIVRYYRKENKHRKYLSNDRDRKDLTMLCQKYYDKEAIQYYRKELDKVNDLLKLTKELSDRFAVPDHIMTRIRPVEYVVQDRLLGFEKLTHGTSGTRSGQYRVTTKEGVLVKSKAEQIIADELFDYKIPFKYELGLNCADHAFKSPDFTVMSPTTGKVYYWEHFGMLDRPDYVNDMVDKMNSYSLTGLIPGDNLILTIADNRRLDVKGFTGQVIKIIESVLL